MTQGKMVAKTSLPLVDVLTVDNALAYDSDEDLPELVTCTESDSDAEWDYEPDSSTWQPPVAPAKPANPPDFSPELLKLVDKFDFNLSARSFFGDRKREEEINKLAREYVESERWWCPSRQGW